MNSSYQVRQKCVGDVSFLHLQRAPTVNYQQPLTLIDDTQDKKFSWGVCELCWHEICFLKQQPKAWSFLLKTMHNAEHRQKPAAESMPERRGRESFDMSNSARQQAESANDTQVVVASLLHEIQNQLQIIKMEFDLLLMSGGEESSAKCSTEAFARIIQSIQKLQNLSGCSNHTQRRRTQKVSVKTRAIDTK